jgi:hypothetical protein
MKRGLLADPEPAGAISDQRAELDLFRKHIILVDKASVFEW